MATGSPTTKHPGVSKRVSRGLEIVLTVIWLSGAAYLYEVHQPGWTEQIVLLLVVLAIEVVFVIWNHGGIKAAAEADKKRSTG